MAESWTLTWNLCDLPATYIGSLEFNDDPRRFEVQGVFPASRHLFRRLDAIPEPEKRIEVFYAYIAEKFHLNELERDHTHGAKRSLRNTYVRYLRGWGVDSNSIEGAVLKAWVESRIGLRPTFHRRKVTADDTDAQLAFATDRMKGMAGSNAINSQLDLVYAFCQYELTRRFPGETWSLSIAEPTTRTITTPLKSCRHGNASCGSIISARSCQTPNGPLSLVRRCGKCEFPW